MPRNLPVDIVGWVGVAALLLAYALVSLRRLEGDSVRFQVLNLAGSAMLMVNSFYYGAYPSVAVNLAWVGIGMFALGRIARRRRRPNKP